VEIDEGVIDRFPFIAGPWSYFRTDQPAEIRGVSGQHDAQWSLGPEPGDGAADG
jgi:hypothetical protein